MKLGLGLSINNRIDSGWTPAKLGANLVMWLQNDTGILESDGSTAEDGDDVTKWTDQSGDNNHMLAANNYFDYDSATGGVESADSTNNKLFLATDGSKNITFSGQFALYARLAIRTKINSSTKVGWTQGSPTLDQFYNFGFERDGDNVLTCFRDNASLTKIETSGYETGAVSGDFVLDAIGGSFDGIIKEVVWVNRALTADERNKLDAYFDKI